MNYRHVYMLIVEHAKSEEKLGIRVKGNGNYYERHHILPKSLFPFWNSRKSNLVLLTAREHFFCHQLLTKIYPSFETACALFYMCNGNKNQRSVISSRDFEKARKLFSEKQSEHKKGQKPWNKGKKCSQLKDPVWLQTEKVRNKATKTLKHRYKTDLEPWNKGVNYELLYTEEERKLRFGKSKGTHQSAETKKKRADKLRGQKRTEEQKLKYREAAKKRAIRYKETGISKAVGERNKELRSIMIYCPQLDKVFSSIKEANKYFHTSRIYDQLERTQQGKLYKGKYQFYRVSKEG